MQSHARRTLAHAHIARHRAVWLGALPAAAQNQLWIEQFGTNFLDIAWAASPDRSGGVYVCGETNFAVPPFTNYTDAWLAHYDSAGNQTWIRQLGTTGANAAGGAAPDGSGGVYVSGQTDGSLGGPGAGDYDAWLARDDGGCVGATTYCTANVSSLGCTPSIESLGTPSVGASAGFVVSGVNTLSNSAGLLMVGISGRVASLLQGGTLCVRAPIKRAPVMNSAGNPPPRDCSGVFDIDMNRYAAGGPLPGLRVAGTVVNCQWWSRDSGFAPPNDVSLSNGLEYTVCP